MISWYFRRFRTVRRSTVSVLSPRIDVLEDRCTPAASFTPSAAFTASVTAPNQAEWSIKTGDFNADGFDDFITSYGASSGKIGVYAGTGAKTFTFFTNLITPNAIQPNSLIFDDFVGFNSSLPPDGRDDVAFIDSVTNKIIIRPSTGVAFAVIPVEIATDFQRVSLASGDFNNDTLTDLFVGRNGGTGPDGTAGEYDVLLNNGNGTFTKLARSLGNGLDSMIQAATVVDIDNDGFNDVVAVNQTAVANTGRAGVYFGKGDGTFTRGAILNVPTNAGISKYSVGDFDGDGLKDVAVFQNAALDSTGFVFYQTAKGVFPTAPQDTFQTGFAVRSVVAADLDLDGLADLTLTSNLATDTAFHFFAGTAARDFTTGSAQSFTTEGFNSPLALIDGNNNGIPDLIVGTTTGTTPTTTAKFQYFDNDLFPTTKATTTVTISATPNPVTYGDNVTFNATVDQFGLPPTGTVEFFANDKSLFTSVLTGGKASFTTNTDTDGKPFAVGALNYQVKYSGDLNYNPVDSLIRSIVVNELASTVSVAITSITDNSRPNVGGDKQSVFGGQVTLEAQVAKVSTFTPVGSFEFYATTPGANPVSTLLGVSKQVTGAGDGKATITTSKIPVGPDFVITAIYLNDPLYKDNTATSALKIDVAVLKTAIEIVSSQNPSVFGQPLTYTVNVVPGSSISASERPFVTPFYEGGVVIFDNDNGIASLDLGSQPAPNTGTGTAVYTTDANYPLGNHTIRAFFAGTPNLQSANSNSFVQRVDRAASTTALSVSKSSIVFGDSVTLTATVAVVAPGVGFPNGTVAFFQNGQRIQDVFVANGMASFVVSALNIGSYDFTASFSGNDQVAGSSTVSAQTVQVTQTQSATTLSVTPADSSLGTPVVLEATVRNAAGLPVNVGTVRFEGTAIAPITVPVANGRASTTLTNLNFGSGTFSVSFSGTDSITASSAGPVSYSVTRAVPGLTLTTTSPSSVTLGGTVPLVATLVPPAGVTLPTTGTISFFDNDVLFATVPVSNGMASTTRISPLGRHRLSASYSGDVNFTPAVSNLVGTNVFRPADRFSVGAGAGGPDRFNVYDSTGKNILPPNLFAFGPDHTAGVRVATADFNGDGIQDVAIGAGPGTGSRVRILNGIDGSPIAEFSPFGAEFTGGVYLAAGDVNGDFQADLVVTPDQRGGARVRLYDGSAFAAGRTSTLADFIGIIDAQGQADTRFRGGARASIGDVNGDGFGDIVMAAGFGGGPRIATFSGKTLTLTGGPKLFGDFLAFEAGLRNGAFVAAGDVNGDGLADIVAGAGPGGGPRVSVFSGETLLAGRTSRAGDFFAGDVNSRVGVPVALRLIDSDDNKDLIVGSGVGDDRVTSYSGSKLFGANRAPSAILSFEVFRDSPDPSDATRGVFVG